MNILKLFTKKPKYEFWMQETNNNGMSRKIIENLQNDGWELAGEIGIKQPEPNTCQSECMLIPFKRKLKL